MASTILRFRNPKIFQVIDERTFRIFFNNRDDFEEKQKKYKSSLIEPRIEVYFEYLKRVRKYSEEHSVVDFFYADRIFYQYDIEAKNGKI